MEYNLAIDQGNSCSKLFLFAGNSLEASCKVEHLEAAHIDEFIAKRTIKGAILSSVVESDIALLERLSKFPHFVELTPSTPMPMAIDYATPATLGRDRIAAAVGAMAEATREAIVVVDAGTAMTLDVVDATGHYRGGNISPGVRMRFAALNNFTARLPLLNSQGDTPVWGYDTSTAIRSGVVNGVLREIEGFVAQVAKTLGSTPRVYVTGGDSPMIASQIGITVIQDSYLLAKGLNRILNYNNENN